MAPFALAPLESLLLTPLYVLVGRFRYYSPMLLATRRPGGGLDLHAGTLFDVVARPTLVTYQEGFALLDPDGDERRIDVPFAIVAHEVAHQWWGGRLVPASTAGAAVLTETLAWDSALGVVEATYGEAHLRRLLDAMREESLSPRARAGVPLLRTVDGFDAYRKGPFAMHALRAYVGDGRVDAALRRLLARHGGGRPPLPTSLDLYRELRAVTPDSLRGLLADLFERNTYWDLRAERATAEPAASAAWRVALDVRARKVTVDEAGVETERPVDDLVEVVVYGADGAALYRRWHRVRAGRQQITVTVPGRPARVGVDPRHLLIDTAPSDNTRDIEGAVATR